MLIDSAADVVVRSGALGGAELHGVFGDDVQVVPKERPDALASAIVAALRQKRRTTEATRATIEQQFRGDAVARQYWSVYAGVIGQ